MSAYKLLIAFTTVLFSCSASNEHGVLPETHFKATVPDHLELEKISEINEKRDDINEHTKYTMYDDEEMLISETHNGNRNSRSVNIPPPHSGSIGPYNPIPPRDPIRIIREVETFLDDTFNEQIRQKREAFVSYPTRTSQPNYFPIPTTPPFHPRFRRNVYNEDVLIQNTKYNKPLVMVETQQARNKREAYVNYPSLRTKNHIKLNIPTTPPFHQRFRRDINNGLNLNQTIDTDLRRCYCVRAPCNACNIPKSQHTKREITPAFMPSRNQNGYIKPYDYRRHGQLKLSRSKSI